MAKLMNVEISYRYRTSWSPHYVTNICDKKCPDRKFWCHKVEPTENTKTYGEWKTTSQKSDQKLCGPASFKKTKRVYYPCQYNGCLIGCPCFACRGLSTGNLETSILFQDHALYHQTWHLDCNFCADVFRIMPFYNFGSVISRGSFMYEKFIPYKTFVFFHSYRLVKLSKSEQLRCEECNLTFQKTGNKYRHDEVKHVGRKYSCQDCGKQFSRQDDLKRHKEQVHRPPILSKCNYCGTEFKDFSSWKRHNDANYDDEGNFTFFNCSECQKKFCSLKLLKKHTRDEHSKLECNDCNKTFSRNSYFSAHMAKAKTACDMCGQSFCNHRMLILHKATSHVKEKFECHVCGKSFSKKWLLDRHQKNAVIKCVKCALTFCNSKTHYSHMIYKHGSWLNELSTENDIISEVEEVFVEKSKDVNEGKKDQDIKEVNDVDNEAD